MTFKALSWTPNELIGERKTKQINENAEYLYLNTPRAVYTLPGGLRKPDGIKIASGKALITKRDRDTASVEVRFGNFFSSRCQPNITTGIIAVGQPRIFCIINGIGTLLPDSRGFQVTVNIDAGQKKNDKIARSFYVAWNAMGY